MTRRIARSHYENFLVASVLLPRRLRQPLYNVYAFCRTADDLADESGSPEDALRGLNALGRELNEALAGRPQSDLFVALQSTVEQFSLSPGPLEDLLDAFRQDQRQTRYRTIDELLDYCRRSANPVGRIVLAIAGAEDPQSVGLADQICTGLQLANFCQDVARDYAIGRIYVPAEEMERFGVREAMFAQPTTPGPLRRLLESECERAEGFLQRGLPLAHRVPRWLAADIKLFAHGGLATLGAIRAIDFDVLRKRPTVGKGIQMRLLIQAALRLL